MKIKEFSFKAILLIFIIFSVNFYNKIEKVVDDSSRCICSYDGFGYYMYNPYLFSKGSLNIDYYWAKDIQNEYCDSALVYQFHPVENGNNLNIYHAGLAIVQMPSYLLADAAASLFNYKRDGFNKPYHLFYLLNALFFIFVGLVYLKKLLRLFFNDKITGYTILLIYLGTNVLVTFGMQYDLTHLYLFAFNTIFLYHLFQYQNTDKKHHLILSAVFLGLTVCIRPTQIIFGIIPLILLFHKHQPNKLIAIKNLLWYPLFGLIWNIPQIYYWYTVGGHFLIPNLHTEEIIIIDPNIIDFLFSYKKGWLLYTPLFLILLVGFYHLFKINRNLFWTFFSFTGLYILVMSSWECWWYASSFGSRVMTDIYPLLAIVLGYALIHSTHKLYKIGLIAFTTACVLLSLFQSYQSIQYIIHPERMTKEQYWHIFGKTKAGDAFRLEIDRQNTDWIHFLEEYEKRGIHYQSKIIYSFKEVMIANPTEDLRFKNFKILDRIPNDETCFIVSFKASTSDSTKSSVLKLETESRFNTYGWDKIEISKNQSQNVYNEFSFQFNLRNIRHKEDKMYLYIDNDNDIEVKIKDFEIKAITLLRD